MGIFKKKKTIRSLEELPLRVNVPMPEVIPPKETKKCKCKYPVQLKVTNVNGYSPRNLRIVYETGDTAEAKKTGFIVDICSDGCHSEVSEEVFEIYFEELPD